MRGLIAYYTKYGNGRRVAEAIGKGIEDSGSEAVVAQLPAGWRTGDYDFVVVGSPTRIGRAMGPAKRFVRGLRKGNWAGKPFVAVGTGVHPREAPSGKRSEAMSAGSADRLYERLEKVGLTPLMGPQKFWVENRDDWSNAKLLEGEEERAREVGRQIGRLLSADPR